MATTTLSLHKNLFLDEQVNVFTISTDQYTHKIITSIGTVKYTMQGIFLLIAILIEIYLHNINYQ